jgi:hypothetical protein
VAGVEDEAGDEVGSEGEAQGSLTCFRWVFNLYHDNLYMNVKFSLDE